MGFEGGVLISILSFLNKDNGKLYLARYPDMFNKWFEEVCTWEESDITKPNRA